ncbi:hypothetical protein KDN34_13655 [Shewanella yunxiaonensis]|uniref:Uncharacterized protein n=1 Tax=Shewanella yunxiaonensis TaxID=2829809 RepID=A0ABX7YRI8_9GAMM|nr:hypothetical protein [Shewanella yunxiaonensis]QUN05234.1 hypothetical protein KDN34_13655 [Shewanella yunxiaonensis]
MARLTNSFWNRNKFKISGLLLILPAYFFYESLHPTFPDALPVQTVGEFTLAPMPLDLNAPYRHDGEYIKDFMVLFQKGDITDIRQAFMNIGPNALSVAQLHDGDLGILHGSRYGQHVHALTNGSISSGDRLWLTIEDWQGEIRTVSWPVPDSWLSS